MINLYKFLCQFLVLFALHFLLIANSSAQPTSGITKIAVQGDTLPPSAGGGTLGAIGAMSLNDNDEVAFTSQRGTFTTEIFISKAGVISRKLSQNDSLPGIGKYGITNGSSAVSLNNQGSIIFNIVVPNTNPAQYEIFQITDQQVISKVIRSGDAAPSGTVEAPGIRPYSLNNNSEIAIEALYSDPFRQAILLNKSGTLTEAVVTGTPTPVGGTFRFAFLHIHDFNDLAGVLFDSSIDTTGSPPNQPIPRDGLFVSKDGVITKIAAVGELAPDGKKYQGFDPLGSMNNLGDIFFEAEACENFYPCYNGLFLYSGSNISLIIKEGDPAPGGGVISVLSSPLINDNKDMIFQASVDNQGSFSQAIFRVNNGVIEKIVSSGDPLPGGGGSFANFNSFASLNANGTLAFTAYLNTGSDSKSGIFLWNSGPRLGLSKDKVEFTDFTPGQTARSEMEISNSGGKTLEVQEITATPNPPFGLDELPSLPISLEAGQKAKFIVTYNPTEAGNGELMKNSRILEDGTLTIRTNAPGPPAAVPIVPPAAYSLLPDGVAIDPANPYLEGGGALHSKFTDLSVSGTGLELVNQVTFDPPDNIEVLRVNATATKVDFDMIVYHDAALGERDIILKTSDGREINITKAAARKFIITKVNTQFNQAVDQAAVSSLQYRDKLVANKHGVLRVQFQDPAQYGQIFNARLEVQGVGTLLSPLIHAPQESYSEAEIVNGRDYLTMPMPQPLSAGKRTFKFVMTRLNDGRLIFGPIINREVITSVAFNIVSVAFRITKPDGSVLNPITDQDARSALDLLKLVYPVSSDMLRYKYVGVRNLPSTLAARTEISHLQNGTEITVFTKEARQIIGPLLAKLLSEINSKRVANGQSEVNMLIAFFPQYVFYSDEDKDGTAESEAIGATSTILNISYQAPESSDIQEVMAHEIGHAFQGSLSLLNVLRERFGFGDEYEGGSFECEKNPPVKEIKGIADVICGNSPFTDGVNGDRNGTFTDQTAFNPVSLRPMLTYRGTSISVTNYNFMSSAVGTDRTWVQPKVYDELLKSFLPLSSGTQGNFIAAKNTTVKKGIQSGAIRLRGTVFSNGRAEFEDFDFISTTERSTQSAGPYLIEFQNSETTTVLASHSFDLNFLELSEPPRVSDHSFFNLVLDFPEGTGKIVLKKNGTLLASRYVSLNAPVIQIATADIVSENQLRITWSASDPDGDSLRYSLLYSADGEDWLPVESNLSSNSYLLETDQFPGASSPLIAITASDGINTGEVELPLASGVTKKKPVVKFTSPKRDTTYDADNPLVLTASAFDPEDGIIADSVLIFSSSIDGLLGKGTPFFVRNLSQGVHMIYVSASDKDGNIATDSLKLSVLAPLGVDDGKNNIPLSFGLSQNYPNPFNPSTNILFELPKSSQVIIKIYNIQGQEIRTLADDLFNAGRYNLRWDGKDFRGKNVSTGIYFIQMRTGEFMRVVKALLLK